MMKRLLRVLPLAAVAPALVIWLSMAVPGPPILRAAEGADAAAGEGDGCTIISAGKLATADGSVATCEESARCANHGTARTTPTTTATAIDTPPPISLLRQGSLIPTVVGIGATSVEAEGPAGRGAPGGRHAM